MKNIVSVIMAVLIASSVAAQAQDLEQLKLDLEKLAQFKAMLSEMQRGYNVLQNGYNSIKDQAKQNFDLHRNYLDGLMLVSPEVRQYQKIQQIIANQSTIVKEFKTAYNKFFLSAVFNTKELSDIDAYYNEVMRLSVSLMDELSRVMTPGRLRMSDAERISVIDRIDTNINSQLMAIRKLITENNQLAVLRGQRKRDINAVKALNGLK